MVLFLVFMPILAHAFSYSVVEVRGSESFFRPQGSASHNRLQSGMSLSDGDSVQTGSGSLVFLLSNEGNEIDIGPNSELYLDVGRGEGNNFTEANLMRGEVRSIIKKDGTHSLKYRLKTRAATLGVRGTDFLSVLEGNSLQVYLAEGVLVLPNNEELAGGNKANLSQSGVSINSMRAGEYSQHLESDGFTGISAAAQSSDSSEPNQYRLNSNDAGDSGKTQLMLAIEHKNVEAVRQLLANGADKNQKDSRGRTAYDYARKSENKQIQDLMYR